NTDRVDAKLYYQTLPRHYIEALRDGNVTDDKGDILYALWENTGKGAPVPMAGTGISFGAVVMRNDFE
ncbi:MAG: hypothetical protein KDI69_11450, partial [Xanthomonadales bacterium]|nr:hypothetical protein [Xanthomonadales bacterium]